MSEATYLLRRDQILTMLRTFHKMCEPYYVAGKKLTPDEVYEMSEWFLDGIEKAVIKEIYGDKS